MNGLADFDVLQVECHPFFQQRGLRDSCIAHDWVFTAYTPLAKGLVDDDDTLVDIATRHGTTPATIALA